MAQYYTDFARRLKLKVEAVPTLKDTVAAHLDESHVMLRASTGGTFILSSFLHRQF